MLNTSVNSEILSTFTFLNVLEKLDLAGCSGIDWLQLATFYKICPSIKKIRFSLASGSSKLLSQLKKEIKSYKRK